MRQTLIRWRRCWFSICGCCWMQVWFQVQIWHCQKIHTRNSHRWIRRNFRAAFPKFCTRVCDINSDVVAVACLPSACQSDRCVNVDGATELYVVEAETATAGCRRLRGWLITLHYIQYFKLVWVKNCKSYDRNPAVGFSIFELILEIQLSYNNQLFRKLWPSML